MKFTEWEELVLQKLIKNEIQGAFELPHLDEDYVRDLKNLYEKFPVDHWKDF